MCRPPRRPSIEAPCSPPITTAFANSGSVCSGIIALLLLQPRCDSSEALENQDAFVILQILLLVFSSAEEARETFSMSCRPIVLFQCLR